MVSSRDYELVAKPSITGITFALMLTIGFTLIIGLGITNQIMKLNYQSDIGHHVEEAFNTVSAPASSQQLGIAIAEIEKNNLDNGYTNWIWKSKCGDLNFWYNTLKQAKADVDRASYEKAWSPEADENAILARHYKVLTDNYGPSLSPCKIHQGNLVALFDIGDMMSFIIIPGSIGTLGRLIARHFVEISSKVVIVNNKPVVKLSDSYEEKLNVDAGFFKTWKLKKE